MSEDSPNYVALVSRKGGRTTRIEVRGNTATREVRDDNGLTLFKESTAADGRAWFRALGALSVEEPEPDETVAYVEWSDGEQRKRWALGSDPVVDKFAAFVFGLVTADRQTHGRRRSSDSAGCLAQIVTRVVVIIVAAIVVISQTINAPEGEQLITFVLGSFIALIAVTVIFVVIQMGELMFDVAKLLIGR